MGKLNIKQFPNPCVLHSANLFCEAAQLLSRDPLMAVPTIVNSAFALELYLKSLNSDLVFSGDVEKQNGVIAYGNVKNIPNKFGHNPSELFDTLSSDVKLDLSCKYEECFQSENLRQVLSAYDGVFAEWRYIFSSEARRLCLTDLLRLLKFLHDYSNQQHKNRVEHDVGIGESTFR